MNKPTAHDEARARDNADDIVGKWNECAIENISDGSLAELSDRIASALTQSRQRAIEVVKRKRDEWKSFAMKLTGCERDTWLNKIVAANEFLRELEG